MVSVDLREQRFKQRGSPGALGDKLAFAHTAHHIEVDHGGDLSERVAGVANKKGGAEESALFACEGDKQKAAGLRVFGEKASECKDRRGAGSVVISAGMDLSEISGESADMAIADMVVVCAQDDDLLLELGVCAG